MSTVSTQVLAQGIGGGGINGPGPGISYDVPTQPFGTNNNLAASTAFVQAAIAGGSGGITQLTGDVTAGPGSGSVASTVVAINGATLGTTTASSGNILIGSGTAWVTQSLGGDATLSSSGSLTLATVNLNTGSFGSGSSIPNFTVNGKGLITAAGSTTLSASNITTGTLPAAQLPNPTLTTLGGIRAINAVSHEWINAISTSGIPSLTQPACGDLSNAATSCSTDATNATNVLFTQVGSGAVQRSITANLDEKWPSLKDFGAVCNGSTDDATALTNASAAFSVVYLGPPASSTGTKCKVSTARTSMTGRLFGDNAQIVDGSGNQRAYFFSSISANQSYTATNSDSIDTAFNGNFTGVSFASELSITGTATLTQPTTGYVYNPWATIHFAYLSNSSGWNQDTADNIGRTQATLFLAKVDQLGQGDAVAFACRGFVNSAKSGATNFLANPAVGCFGADVQAGQAGVFLNPVEIDLSDNGFDVAGIAYVANLNRTVNTGALGVAWGGITLQSNGTDRVDFGVRLTGGYITGIDMVNGHFDGVGMAMSGNNNTIDFNATANGTYGVTTSLSQIVFVSGVGMVISDPTAFVYTSDENSSTFTVTAAGVAILEAAAGSAILTLSDDAGTNQTLINFEGGTTAYQVGANSSGIFFIFDNASSTSVLSFPASGDLTLSSHTNINLAPTGDVIIEPTGKLTTIKEHLASTTASAPTLTAGCNGTGSSVTGTDTAGVVIGKTVASTTCTLTFGTAYSSAPQCTVSPLNVASFSTPFVTVSASTIVTTFTSTANIRWSYHCFGS